MFGVSYAFILAYTWDTGGVPYYSAYFGAGTGLIYLDDVACTSSASQLLECSSRPILTHNCLHSRDAGVGCKGTLIHKKPILTENNGTPNDVAIVHIYIVLSCSSLHSWSAAVGGRKHSK